MRTLLLIDANSVIHRSFHALPSFTTPSGMPSGALYGLYQGGPTIRKEGLAMLVEGYMDVLACHQHGLTNVVAPLGTAVTPDHGQLLKRYAEKGESFESLGYRKPTFFASRRPTRVQGHKCESCGTFLEGEEAPGVPECCKSPALSPYTKRLYSSHQTQETEERRITVTIQLDGAQAEALLARRTTLALPEASEHPGVSAPDAS